jgi:hypothetical protein
MQQLYGGGALLARYHPICLNESPDDAGFHTLRHLAGNRRFHLAVGCLRGVLDLPSAALKQLPWRSDPCCSLGMATRWHASPWLDACSRLWCITHGYVTLCIMASFAAALTLPPSALAGGGLLVPPQRSQHKWPVTAARQHSKQSAAAAACHGSARRRRKHRIP